MKVRINCSECGKPCDIDLLAERRTCESCATPDAPRTSIVSGGRLIETLYTPDGSPYATRVTQS